MLTKFALDFAVIFVPPYAVPCIELLKSVVLQELSVGSLTSYFTGSISTIRIFAYLYGNYHFSSDLS